MMKDGYAIKSKSTGNEQKKKYPKCDMCPETR